MHTLLWLEERQLNADIATYTMRNVALTPAGIYLRLEVCRRVPLILGTASFVKGLPIGARAGGKTAVGAPWG